MAPTGWHSSTSPGHEGLLHTSMRPHVHAHPCVQCAWPAGSEPRGTHIILKEVARQRSAQAEGGGRLGHVARDSSSPPRREHAAASQARHFPEAHGFAFDLIRALAGSVYRAQRRTAQRAVCGSVAIPPQTKRGLSTKYACTHERQWPVNGRSCRNGGGGGHVHPKETRSSARLPCAGPWLLPASPIHVTLRR
jgi:hypothetical protein